MRNSLALLCIPFAACLGQSSSAVSLSNGVQVRIVTNAPGGGSVWKPELQPATGNSFYRIYWDENDLAVFAYEVGVERAGDGDKFKVTAKPTGTEFAVRFPNADGGKPVPTLGAPMESSLLNSGEHFSVEIPSDTGGAGKLTDTIQTELNPQGVSIRESDDSSAARLRFESLKVWIDGALASPGGAGAIVAGRYVMFYLPGRGGYFFSSEPVMRQAFAQIGFVEDGKLRFTLENSTYECQSDASILLKSERGEIWVYHDPGYKPAGNWTRTSPGDDDRDEYFTAASDSLNWWLR